MRLHLVDESLSAAREYPSLRNWLWSVNLSRFETVHTVCVNVHAPTSTDRHTLQDLDRSHEHNYASELQLIYLDWIDDTTNNYVGGGGSFFV
jgi:hypothetical protein